jgi:ABC-type transport system involved in cytochrome c biogenesis permease subunit
MMAYVLLLLTVVCSFVALAVKKKRQVMYHLSQLMLYPSLTLLGFGIFIGAIWANISWGNYWSWDPKETWALITLMVYAVPAHRSLRLNYHLYMTLAFLAIIMTYFGVNYFLGGLHSYA